MTLWPLLLVTPILLREVLSQCIPINEDDSPNTRTLLASATTTCVHDGSPVDLHSEAPDGTVCNAVCKPDTYGGEVGYAFNITCEIDAYASILNGCKTRYEWTGTNAFTTCAAPPCTPLGESIGADAITCNDDSFVDNPVVGAECTVSSCLDGFVFSPGNNTHKCEVWSLFAGFGVWEHSAPSCKRTPCPPFVSPVEGADAYPECKNGSGIWDIGPVASATKYGDQCYVECHGSNGASAENSNVWTCGDGGQWINDDPPTCRPISCPVFSDVIDTFEGAKATNCTDVNLNAIAPTDATRLDTRCRFECAVGFKRASNSIELLCYQETSYIWDRPEFNDVAGWKLGYTDLHKFDALCIPVCPELTVDDFEHAATITCDSSGSECGPVCDAGYTLFTENDVPIPAYPYKCNGDMKWSGSAICAPDCSPVNEAITPAGDGGLFSQIANADGIECRTRLEGAVNPDRPTSAGTACEVQCSAEYMLADSDVSAIRCGGDGEWSSELPQCVSGDIPLCPPFAELSVPFATLGSCNNGDPVRISNVEAVVESGGEVYKNDEMVSLCTFNVSATDRPSAPDVLCEVTSCADGYQLLDNPYFICSESGTWESAFGKAVECVAVDALDDTSSDAASFFEQDMMGLKMWQFLAIVGGGAIALGSACFFFYRKAKGVASL